MSIFDKKTEKAALANGGKVATAGARYTPEEMELALRLVREIGNQEANGFFMVVHTSKEGENHTRAEGMMKVRNMPKDRVLSTVMRSLDMDAEAIQQYLMLQALSDN